MAFQQAAQVQAHGDITVAVRDTNMPIRGAPLCYDAAGLFTSKGLTSWAALCHHIWTPLQGLYDGGIDTVVEQLDGRCPRAKEWVQHKRKTTAESSKKREQKKDDAIKKEEDGDVVIKEEAEGEEEDSEPLVSRFKWPEQDDGLPWFQLDQRPQCGINDMYESITAITLTFS